MKKIEVLGKTREEIKNAVWYVQALEAGVEVFEGTLGDGKLSGADCLYLVFDENGAAAAKQGVWCKEGPAPAGFRYSLERQQEVPLWYLEMVHARNQGKPWVVCREGIYEIREMTLKDLPLLYELYAAEGVREYVEPLEPLAQEEEFTRSYIRNMYGFYGYGLWLVFHTTTGELIGRAGFSHREIDGAVRVELGYIIGQPWQGQGHGTAICRKLLELGRERWEIEEVFACCSEKNRRSAALARKLGFQSYGTSENMQIFRYKNQ